jgi:hypothetical protein
LEAKRTETCEGIWQKGLSLISHSWWSEGREKESGGEDKSLGNPNPRQVVGCSFGKEQNVCSYLEKCDCVSISWRRKRTGKKNIVLFWSGNLVLFCLEGSPD